MFASKKLINCFIQNKGLKSGNFNIVKRVDWILKVHVIQNKDYISSTVKINSFEFGYQIFVSTFHIIHE